MSCTITYSQLIRSSTHLLGYDGSIRLGAFHPHVFLQKFHKNICKGVNFDMIFKLKVSSLAKQIPPWMLSGCLKFSEKFISEQLQKHDLAAEERTLTRILLWKFQASKESLSNPQPIHLANSFGKSCSVLSFLFRETTKVTLLKFLRNRCMKNFAKLSSKHVHRSLFSVKLQASSMQFYWDGEETSVQVFLCSNFAKFCGILFE